MVWEEPRLRQSTHTGHREWRLGVAQWRTGPAVGFALGSRVKVCEVYGDTSFVCLILGGPS